MRKVSAPDEVVGSMLVRFRRRSAPVDVPALISDANDPVQELVAARITSVETALTAVAGGVSLCSISRSGGRVDGVKYLEGKLAVLMEVRRKLRTGGDPGGVVADTADAWRRALADAEERGHGPDWLAYRAGGVDEIDELRGLLPAPRGTA